MRKITLFAVAALAISFASCKKDRTCTCTHSNSVTSATTTDVYTITKATKSTAKAACVSTKSTENGVTSTSDCKLS